MDIVEIQTSFMRKLVKVKEKSNINLKLFELKSIKISLSLLTEVSTFIIQKISFKSLKKFYLTPILSETSK